MKHFIGTVAVFVLTLLAPCRMTAQCDTENTAFSAGESLTYDLYFNWKFIWVKAGTAYYDIRNDVYEGKNVLRSDLLCVGNKRCNALFPMKDTLTCYFTPTLVPLYFRKGATEGRRYTISEVRYSYPDNKSRVHLRYFNKDRKWSDSVHISDECNYDMLSILALARSFDPTNYKVGQKIHFQMATGRKVEEQTLIYMGKENFTANDDVTYRCLVFSLLDYEEKEKSKELLRFYVTDDLNHLPIRIDFYLKFGTAKAFYIKGKGLRNPMNSIIKKK